MRPRWPVVVTSVAHQADSRNEARKWTHVVRGDRLTSGLPSSLPAFADGDYSEIAERARREVWRLPLADPGTAASDYGPTISYSE